MINKISLIFFTSIILLLISSCSSVTYEKIYPTLQDGKYDSEFPYKGSSQELENLSKTVQRINSTAFYKTYVFNSESEIRLSQINGNISALAISEGYADQTSSGSGTIIYAKDGKVALLTCAHVVNYPDTIISYHRDEFGNLTDLIEAIFIKSRQTIYVPGFPEGSEFEIIASNKNLDIALVGRDYKSLSGYKFPEFNFPIGHSKELEWGTFVYVFGYPLNYQMVTKAIVSSPNKDEQGSFLIDAVVNKGSSGGIVLAIRDGVPNFELVGMVQWVPEEEENVLIPEKRKDDERYNPIIPYEGDLFVKKFSSMKYGIARIISVESVVEFLTAEKDLLYEKKYFIENFISKK